MVPVSGKCRMPTLDGIVKWTARPVVLDLDRSGKFLRHRLVRFKAQTRAPAPAPTLGAQGGAFLRILISCIRVVLLDVD